MLLEKYNVGFYFRSTRSVSYLPYYGGAKGQYLEVTKSKNGSVLDEKIVTEETAAADDAKSTDLLETLRALHTRSGALLRLHEAARVRGALERSEAGEYKTRLNALADTATDLLKLAGEIGDNVHLLFRTKKSDYEEDVSTNLNKSINVMKSVENRGQIQY